MIKKLFITWSLNVVDGGYTLWLLARGFAVEGNLLMAGLLEAGPVLFILFKCVVVGLGLVFLYKYRDNRFANMGVNLLFVIYAVLVGYHIISALLIVKNL